MAFSSSDGRSQDAGLEAGETVLFMYRSRLRFVAKAETGRMDNTYLKQADYPYCFVIDLRTLRPTDMPVEDLERRLRAEAGLQKSLQGQGWTIIPDSERAEEVIDALISE